MKKNGKDGVVFYGVRRPLRNRRRVSLGSLEKTTKDISIGATAAVEAALEELAGIEDVIVSKSSDAWTIRFSGRLRNTDVPLLQADAKLPTDGTLAQTLSLDYDVASRLNKPKGSGVIDENASVMFGQNERQNEAWPRYGLGGTGDIPCSPTACRRGGRITERQQRVLTPFSLVNITCVHCGRGFSITAEQLGTRGKCPHCFATIVLPKSERAHVASGNRKSPFTWAEKSLSGAASILFHLCMLAMFMVVPWSTPTPPDRTEGTSVEIGSLREEPLVDSRRHWDLSAIQQARIAAFDMSHDRLQPPTDDRDRISARFARPFASAASGTEDATGFGSLSSFDPSDDGLRDFGQLVERLKRDGLDIVITFDSTGSMDAEIRQVKSKIERIGGALFKLVPKTRISFCTYRDEGDAYVTQGLKLTDNLSKVSEYLGTIAAEGGGDTAEAVDQGLGWAIEQNQFRPAARKVVLLFGDAPPHPDKRKACLELVSNFRHQKKGTVSTVTCHSDERLPEFVEIALAGGGEAFLSRDDREIMTQLMVLVFGSQHQQKVIDALDLLRQ